MDKKFMVFGLTESQLKFLRDGAQAAVKHAIASGDEVKILQVVDLVAKLREAREQKPRKSGWGAAIREQVLG